MSVARAAEVCDMRAARSQLLYICFEGELYANFNKLYIYSLRICIYNKKLF